MHSVTQPRRFLMFDLDERARHLQSKGIDVIYMAIGRSEEPTPSAITESIVATLQDGELSHEVSPCGIPPLRQAIAEHYNTVWGGKIQSEQAFVCPGTSPIYLALFALLCSPGDIVVLPKPFYPLYAYSAAFARLRPRYYTIDPKSGLVDVAELRSIASADSPKLILSASFGNPLGNVVAADCFEELYRICEDYGARLWSDETYGNVDFYGRFRSAISFDPYLRRTILTSGFSKGYRMYTRRVGYCALGADLAPVVASHLEHAVLTVDPAAQYGALTALRRKDDPIHLASLYRNRCEKFYEAFTDMPELLTRMPAGGFNITLDCGSCLIDGDSHQLALDILDKTHVAVTPGIDFGLEHHLRITLTSVRFEEGIQRLKDYFRRRKGRGWRHEGAQS